MKKILALVFCVMLAILTFAGCAAKMDAPEGGYYTEDSMVEEPMADEENSIAGAAGVESFTTVTPDETDRKLIYTAYYSINTVDIEGSYKTVMNAVEQAGGYLSNENTYGTEPEEIGDSGRTTYMTVRIPIENFDSFIAVLGTVGEVTSKSLSTEDITDEYFDVDARIEMLEGRLERLKEHLAEATEMEDIIALEAEISDVLYELDSYKGTMRKFNDRIEYSTVNIDLYEVVQQGDVVISKKSFGDRVGEDFMSVLKWLGNFFTEFARIMIAASPVFVVLGAIACAIVLPIHFSKKRRKARAAKKAEENK